MYAIIVLTLMCSFSSIITEETTELEHRNDNLERHFPYFVVLRSKYSKGSHRICGGVIIKSSLIITAAECVYHTHPVEIEVRDATGNSHIKIARIVTHPEYSWTSCNNIAALHTTFDIDFSESVHAVTLPPRNYQISEKEPLISPKWGQRPFTGYGTFAKESRFFIAYAENEKCANKNCLNSTFCTANTPNICSDSNMGSPLELKSMLVGILSNFATTCSEGKPVPYTSISAHIDFIEENELMSNKSSKLVNVRRRGNIISKQQLQNELKAKEEKEFTFMMKALIFLGFLFAMFCVAGAFLLLVETPTPDAGSDPSQTGGYRITHSLPHFSGLALGSGGESSESTAHVMRPPKTRGRFQLRRNFQRMIPLEDIGENQHLVVQVPTNTSTGDLIPLNLHSEAGTTNRPTS